MIVSSKGRYALRVMVDLARNGQDGVVSLKAIAERQEVSLKYLEAIVATLLRAGMLTSRRGKEGGYRLARPAAQYTAAEILRGSEGDLAPVSCLECTDSGCEKAQACPALPVWQQLDALIEEYLSGITLADLADGCLPQASLQWTPCPPPQG